MKNILLLSLMFYVSNAVAVCTSPITRTNFTNREVLTSTRLNTELNTIYGRTNELPGDCITDATVSSSKIADGTIVNADIATSAAIDMTKVKYYTAIVSDTKPSGTAAGASTANTWVDRNLNTEVDPDNIVTITSNQFSLAAGTYEIEGYVPAYAVIGHKAKLFNVTDNADSIMGTNEYTFNTDGVVTHSKLMGVVTITSAKSFKVSHYTQTNASDGFGRALTIPSVPEVYTIIKITKIK